MTDVFNFVACLAEAEPSFSIGFVRNVRRGIHEGAYFGAQPPRERPMQRFLPPVFLSSHVDESEQPNCRSSGWRHRKLLKSSPLTGFNSPVLRQRLKRLKTIVWVHIVSGWRDLSAISALSLTI